MFTESLAPFFSDFGQPATVAGVAASVIFDADYAAANVGAMVMSGAQPAITVQTASLPASPVGAAVVTGGKTYTIAEHRPDGQGISVCLLESAA